MRVSEIAQRIGAELAGPGDIDITGINGIHDARAGELTYVTDEKHFKALDGCRASAVIVPMSAPAVALPSLKVRNPRYAFALVLRIFHEQPYRAGGVSDRAVISGTAVVGADPTIHPCVVVADGARIGDRVTLHPGTVIGAGSVVGDDSVIHANVTVREGVVIGRRAIIHAGTVIGSDGFGFVTEGGVHHKIPQVGGVVIGDDVEIGANTTIDRATLGNTVIGSGTKIDNQVQIAHNVTVGEHCLLAAQMGIAGSTVLGRYVVIGGQAGVTDHVRVGDQVMAGGGTGITRDIDAGQVIAGHPAQPLRDWLKMQAVLMKLPEMKRSLAQLARRIEDLEKQSEGPDALTKKGDR